MGRLSEFFNQHRDNVEDAVERALAKADATIDSMAKRIEQLEQQLRDVAGSAVQQNVGDQELNAQNAGVSDSQGVVTSDDTNSAKAQNVQGVTTSRSKTARK